MGSIDSFDVLFAGSLNNEIVRQIARDGVVIYEK
ncbi:hypothetical protein HNQ82_000437 [Anoxybacillus tengchongensis]|uniref:Uncharacterized protein n=1 Tax=Anoxybacillus tengchongensis TaxID=576944 RepID=A0A7W9YP38_9BACL|nr:hypothetical protein [Anoxybacillus tengchongensis]